MKITILGSGTGYPTLRRSACAVLMAIGEDRLLFDMGLGTLRRLLESGTALSDVTHIFFSHHHPDHCAEFPSFLFASKYPASLSRQRPITVIGRGVDELYAQFRGIYGRWIEPEPALLNLLDLDRIDQPNLAAASFRIEIRPVPHIESSVGYRVTASDGTTVVYTGDTAYSEDVVALAQDADMLITEASVPDGQDTEGHLTPSLAGRIAAEAGVGRLVLTHFYPECDGVNLAAQCRRTWSGPLTLAEDLLTLWVSAGEPREAI